MSSGAHLTKDTYDLVKSIGESQSKQEEDKIMLHEYTQLKAKINDKNLSTKQQKENLIKAIYLEMLGHDASFAYIHAVNLTQNKTLSLKKLGYLACSLFFHENQQFLILLVSTIQKDLLSQNIQEVLIALNALSKLLYESIVHPLSNQILSLLNHKNGVIRKKTIMIVYRMYCIQPNLVMDLDEKLKKILCDQDPSVMGAVLNIYYEQIKKEGSSKYKDIISSFVVILKQIIENKLSRDFDYHRMPAPWIQIKLLQIIGLLASADQKASEHVYEILQMALNRADDTGINIGYSIVFQCVKTIAQIYPNINLLDMAATSIAKFFHSGNNNLKYLGINSLKMLMNIDVKYASNHQITVVECLESPDETLKRETLELLFKMTNQDNIEVIIERLMGHLKQTNDLYFKKEMVNKILQLVERFAPSQEWFFLSINSLFQYASEHINNEILNDMIKIIYEISSEDENFTEFMFNSYEEIIQQANLADPFVKLISWIFGQMGPKFCKIKYFQDQNNNQKLNQIVDYLAKLIEIDYQDSNTILWIINSLAKIQGKMQNNQKIKEIFQKYQFSKNTDIQQRCVEFNQFPQFIGFLQEGNQIQKVDSQLQFLNGFVQSARNKGAKEYKDSIFQKCFLNQQTSQQQLVFQPYSVMNQKSIVVNESNESGLNIQGPQKWGKQGYVKEEVKQDNSFVKPSQSFTQSISSSQIKQQSGISSNDFKGNTQPVISAGGVISNNSQTSTQNFDILPQMPKIFIDPKEKQKQQLASQLFGTTKLPIAQKKTVQQNPQKNQDLFDLNEVPQQKNNQFQQSAITIEQYEQNWETLPIELALSLQTTKIRTLEQFKQLINQINFQIVEIISNEIICAGSYNQNLLLMYADFQQNGDLSVKVKTKVQSEGNALLDLIRKHVF